MYLLNYGVDQRFNILIGLDRGAQLLVEIMICYYMYRESYVCNEGSGHCSAMLSIVLDYLNAQILFWFGNYLATKVFEIGQVPTPHNAKHYSNSLST